MSGRSRSWDIGRVRVYPSTDETDDRFISTEVNDLLWDKLKDINAHDYDDDDDVDDKVILKDGTEVVGTIVFRAKTLLVIMVEGEEKHIKGDDVLKIEHSTVISGMVEKKKGEDPKRPPAEPKKEPEPPKKEEHKPEPKPEPKKTPEPEKKPEPEPKKEPEPAKP